MSGSSRTSKKFLFDRSFDDPAKLYLPGERRKSEIAAAAASDAADAMAAQELPPLPDDLPNEPAAPEIKVEFTQAQLDGAREEGYIAGHNAALEEAGTAREHYVADAINLIAQNLEKLDEQQTAANTTLSDLAMRMIYGITQRLLPPFAHAHAVDSIEHFVREVLPIAVGEPRILVRAHEMIAADLNERLANLEAEKKSVTSDFASKIAAVEGEIASDSNHIRSGYEYRSLDCTIHFDKPRAGRKQFIRDDNGEIVGDEAMEDYDRQAVMDFEKSEKE